MKIISTISILLALLFLSTNTFAQTPELRVPSTHEGSKFAFSKNDKIMVSVGQNELKVWDTEGPYLLKSVPLLGSDTSYNTNLYVTPDDKKVVVNMNGNIKILNLQTFEWNKASWKIPEPRMEGMSADGKTLYYFLLTEKGVATLFKLTLETGKSTKLFTFSPEDAMSFGGDLCISPDESLLISSSDLGGVMIDLKTAKIIHQFQSPQQGLFINEAGNLITSTQIKMGDSDKDTYGVNRKFKVEEIEPRSMKVLRTLTLTTKSDDIPEYNGIYWIGHNNRDKVMYEVNKHFYIVNTNTFTQSKRQKVVFDTEPFSSNFAMLSAGGKFVFWSGYMTAFKTDDVKKPYRFGISPYQPFMLSDVSKGDELRAVAGSKLISFEPRGLVFTQFPKAKYVDFHSTYRYLPSQKRLFMEGMEFSKEKYQGPAYVYDLKNDTSQFSMLNLSKGVNDDVVAMREYDEFNTLVLLGRDRFFLMDTRTLKVKTQVNYGEGLFLSINTGQKDDNHYCDLSPDKSKIVIFLTKEERQGDNNLIVCFDLVNKRALWKYDGESMTSNPVYTEGGKTIQFFDNNKKLIVLDAISGKVISKNSNFPNTDYTSFFSPKQKYVLNTTFDEVFFYGGISNYDVYDVATKKLVMSLPKPQVAYKNCVFMSNDRYLLTQDEDLKLWDLEKRKLVARIITFQNSNDWIMLTPDGRFDGSKGGLDQLYYVKGQEIIPLDQLSEGFYTPSLMKQVLAGVEADAKKDIKNIKSPPSVKLTYAPSSTYIELTLEGQIPEIPVDVNKVQLDVEANANGDVIEELRLYHNGKLVGNKTRNLVVEDEKSGLQKKAYDVELEEGENRFKVVAINSQRTESKPKYLTLIYKPKTSGSTRPSEGASLHVLVIGLNKYKNPKYNLNYATADATSFKEAIEKNSNTIFSKINTIYLGDENATKAGIISELEKIKSKANPKDVFIFYYAGHGVLNEKKEFFLVPHDVTQLYGADDALAQKGLSANELQQFSRDIKAQKQLFILDACQSAGALEALVAARGAAEEKAISQLARATGTHWLTASGSEQFASEFTQLGHGTFTYALLEALSGKADKGNDKKITVKELDAYLQEVVPEMTAKYKGTPQYPSSYGFGNDFPIGVVKN